MLKTGLKTFSGFLFKTKFHTNLEFILIDPKYNYIFSQFSQGKTPVSLKLNIGCVFALKLKLKLDQCAVLQVKGGLKFELKIKII